MGLTKEEILQRDKSLLKLKITTYNDKKGYVFVSYKSDNWRAVFSKVFALQEMGLNVYSDKNFDDTNEPWLDDMAKNIKYCSAFMLFVSKEYLVSYATLIELLTAIRHEKPIIPVCFEMKDKILGELTEDVDLEDDYVKMKPGEFQVLKNLLENTNVAGFKDALSQINSNIRRKIETEKLSKMNIVEAFQSLLENDKIKENLFDKDISSLKNTIIDAAKNSKHQNVFEEELQALKQEEKDITINGTKLKTNSVKSQKSKTVEKIETPEIKNVESKINTVIEPVNPTGNMQRTIFEVEKPKNIHISASTKLKEFREMFLNRDFCLWIRSIREDKLVYSIPKQIFDYAMASALKGCDGKVTRDDYRWNYCVYVVLNEVDVENPVLGAGQFTWSSNARKAANIAGSGKLGSNNDIFEMISEKMTLGELQQKYAGNAKEPFVTKNNEALINVWNILFRVGK